MSDAEVPDADAQEQRRTVDGRIPDEPGVVPTPRRGAETPDADALEQAEEVPEDDDRRG